MTESGRSVHIGGRILYLTEDQSAARAAARRRKALSWDPERQADRQHLDRRDHPRDGSAITTMRRWRATAWWGCAAGSIKKDTIKDGGFQRDRQRASRRAAVQLAGDGALQRAGRRGAARHRARTSRRSTGRTRRTSGCSRRTDFSLLERIERGERSRSRSSPRGSTRSARTSCEHGGLFAYNKARLRGRGLAARRWTTAAAPHDALREDHRRGTRWWTRENGTARRARGRARRRLFVAPTCASATST
jgi:3-isopropylmalate/(R)-2-methylmalate dehydratase large subunit